MSRVLIVNTFVRFFCALRMPPHKNKRPPKWQARWFYMLGQEDRLAVTENTAYLRFDA